MMPTPISAGFIVLNVLQNARYLLGRLFFRAVQFNTHLFCRDLETSFDSLALRGAPLNLIMIKCIYGN